MVQVFFFFFFIPNTLEGVISHKVGSAYQTWMDPQNALRETLKSPPVIKTGNQLIFFMIKLNKNFYFRMTKPDNAMSLIRLNAFRDP